MQTSLRVCFFGEWDPAHNPTKALMRGLESQGAQIIPCFSKVRGKGKYLDLLKKFLPIRSSCDVVIVTFSGDRLMPLMARVITWRKLLLWDVGFSFYDNFVFDRKLVRAGSLKARYHWFFDWFNIRVVDRVILDFKTHQKYYQTMFGLNLARSIFWYGGADTAVFYPRPKSVSDNVFRIEYHGKYIPVHGVETVLRAAKILESETEIHFTLIGDGQERKKVEDLAKELRLMNLRFLPFLPLSELPAHVANADLCIGLIGDVPRVSRTVANKVYETAAMGRVSVNADGDAIREIFTDGVDIVLIPPGNAEALAEKILQLKANPALVERMSQAAYQTFQKECSSESIGKRLIAGIRNAQLGDNA